MSVPQQFAEESILAAARPIDRQKRADLTASIDEWEHVTLDVGFDT